MHLQEMLVTQFCMQPGDSTDVPTKLIEKRPPITVDRNGGSFLLSVGHAGAHTLASGGDRARDRSSGGHMA